MSFVEFNGYLQTMTASLKVAGKVFGSFMRRIKRLFSILTTKLATALKEFRQAARMRHSLIRFLQPQDNQTEPI
jgi:hypothetical protein